MFKLLSPVQKGLYVRTLPVDHANELNPDIFEDGMDAADNVGVDKDSNSIDHSKKFQVQLRNEKYLV